jgi:hypothetical protein
VLAFLEKENNSGGKRRDGQGSHDVICSDVCGCTPSMMLPAPWGLGNLCSKRVLSSKTTCCLCMRPYHGSSRGGAMKHHATQQHTFHIESTQNVRSDTKHAMREPTHTHTRKAASATEEATPYTTNRASERGAVNATAAMPGRSPSLCARVRLCVFWVLPCVQGIVRCHSVAPGRSHVAADAT